MPRRLLLAAIALAAATGAAARAPGTTFYRCSVLHDFTLPGGHGNPVRTQNGQGAQTRIDERPEAAEQILASLDVEEQGQRSNLSLSWAQSGLFAPPDSRRLDIEPLYLSASFSHGLAVARSGSAFDPDGVEIQLFVRGGRRMDRPVMVRIFRAAQPYGLTSLGGPAEIVGYPRPSAKVRLSWRDLAAIARDEQRLTVALTEIGRTNDLLMGRHLAGGVLDLSIMPRLFEAFRAAEARLGPLAADPPRNCHRLVQPEPSDDAII